jgi:hypothetical protein
VGHDKEMNDVDLNGFSKKRKLNNIEDSIPESTNAVDASLSQLTPLGQETQSYLIMLVAAIVKQEKRRKKKSYENWADDEEGVYMTRPYNLTFTKQPLCIVASESHAKLALWNLILLAKLLSVFFMNTVQIC